MEIDTKETVHGVSIIAIRNMLKIPQGFTPLYVQNKLKADTARAELILKYLCDKGFIKFEKEYWRVTMLGNSFSQAMATPRIYRKTAEDQLQKFLERVNIVNSQEKYLCGVTAVVVFGSYLTDKDRLGDLDVAFSLVSKFEGEERHNKNHQRVMEAIHKGKRFNNIVDEICWPQNEVTLFLKNRKRTLSFHTFEELVDLISDGHVTKYKIVYAKAEALRALLSNPKIVKDNVDICKDVAMKWTI
jgi:hypothetical protein